MTTPAVELTNQALRMIGAETITTFEEGTDLGETCQRLYADTARALLTAYPWRCTLRKQQLSRQLTAPVNEWLYAHSLPPDMLVLRQLFPTASPGSVSVREYEIFGTQVLSNQPDLWADYQAEIDPAIWPPYLRDVGRHALAAVLAIPVTESRDRAEWFDRLAFGTPQDERSGGLMRAARRLDAMQQPPQGIEDFPLIAARFGGMR